MSATICSKCRQLCPDEAPVCPRCHAIDELLLSVEVLHSQVRRALDRPGAIGEATLAKSALVRHLAAVKRVGVLR